MFIPSGNDNDFSHFTKGFPTHCLLSLIISWGKQGRFSDLILQGRKLRPREVISCISIWRWVGSRTWAKLSSPHAWPSSFINRIGKPWSWFLQPLSWVKYKGMPTCIPLSRPLIPTSPPTDLLISVRVSFQKLNLILRIIALVLYCWCCIGILLGVHAHTYQTWKYGEVNIMCTRFFTTGN